MMIGNPMAHPMAADSVKMPQDLQAGYMHMNRFGSPLPMHGLGTPGRTSIANMMQDQNFMAYHKAIIGNRNPMGMSRIPFGAISNMEDNRKEALNKATNAKQKMMMEAEMMKQLQPTVPEVTAANIDMQPAIIPNPKPEGPVINANVFNPGNLYPGISGSSKLAANWNPMMDPAAG